MLGGFAPCCHVWLCFSAALQVCILIYNSAWNLRILLKLRAILVGGLHAWALTSSNIAGVCTSPPAFAACFGGFQNQVHYKYFVIEEIETIKNPKAMPPQFLETFSHVVI